MRSVKLKLHRFDLLCFCCRHIDLLRDNLHMKSTSRTSVESELNSTIRIVSDCAAQIKCDKQRHLLNIGIQSCRHTDPARGPLIHPNLNPDFDLLTSATTHAHACQWILRSGAVLRGAKEGGDMPPVRGLAPHYPTQMKFLVSVSGQIG